MPRGDGTGPLGMGPMSGRTAGYCAGFGMPGYANPAPGRGFGKGFARGRGSQGGGRGWRHWFYATGLPRWARLGGSAMPQQQPDRELERQALKGQADAMQSELDLIKKRLSEIEAGSEVK